MKAFTSDSSSPVSNKIFKKIFCFVGKIDERGRVIVPAYIRKKLNLKADSEVFVMLEKNGQSSVTASTKVCGALRPGSTPGFGLKRERR